MRNLRISLVLILIWVCGQISAGNPQISEFKDTKEKVTYKGEKYTIYRSEYSFRVVNKKYDIPAGNLTTVLPLPGEYDENLLRERFATFNREIYKIAYSVFTPEQKHVFLTDGGLTAQQYYFETKTGKYFGVYFFFDNKFKDIVTIDKIYEMEQKLLKSNIKVDISKLNLDKSNKKYFLY